MTVSVGDIDRWDAGDVREVFHATRSRAEAAFEAADGIAQLPAFESWGGDAAEAAKDAIGQTRKDLDAHGNEALAVAQAGSKAADEIGDAKRRLAELREAARKLKMELDTATGSFVPAPGSQLSAPEALVALLELQPQLDQIVADAAAAAADLTRAIEMASGEEPIPDSPHTNDPVLQQILSKPLPEDPQQFTDMWEKLSPEQKEFLYGQDHFIGNHPGMPFVDKNILNQRHLHELTDDAQAQVDRLGSEHPGWAAGGAAPNPKGDYQRWRQWRDWKQQWDTANHTLDGYHAVSGVMDNKDGATRYLAIVDERGHAAVSIGNPDTASRNAILVPGTGQDLAAFEGSDRKSDAMMQATLQADRTLTAQNVSITTWMGYDRPMDLAEAALPGRAESGGSALDRFLDGMHASHHGPAALDTVIGHSYGSTLVGGAATGDNHLAADNVIAVGSPGMLIDEAADLNLDPGSQVYSMTARNDIISLATDMTLGPDPFGQDFGATRLWADPGPSWDPSGVIGDVEAHSSYWSSLQNPALENLGAIIAGLPPLQVVTPEGVKPGS